MTDAEALAELAADLRAELLAAVARGARIDALGAAPVADAPPPAPSASDWAAIAVQARAGHEAAAVVGAAGLHAVREDLGDCRRCRLCTGRRNIVFGVGDPDADLLVIGEAPGRNEDVQGEPFVGDAGEMLDRMLLNVLGLPREAVYICNVVKCRPPENRNPLPDEVDACLPFLRRQIAAVRPKVILVLGSVAFRTLFGSDVGIMKGRGAWREHDGVPAMSTFHPAYLLRKPQDKRLTFEDLQQVKARYDAVGGRRTPR